MKRISKNISCQCSNGILPVFRTIFKHLRTFWLKMFNISKDVPVVCWMFNVCRESNRKIIFSNIFIILLKNGILLHLTSHDTLLLMEKITQNDPLQQLRRSVPGSDYHLSQKFKLFSDKYVPLDIPT